jgi:hypothetical protein
MGRVKNLEEIETMIRERAGQRNTFRHAKREDVESVLVNLTSKDPKNGRPSPSLTKKRA